jgi:hypothetical protein
MAANFKPLRLVGAHDPLHHAIADTKLAGDLENADLLLSQLAYFRQQLWIVAAKAMFQMLGVFSR